MNLHILKLKREYYYDVLCNRKTFELRKNDRDFRVGDELVLRAVFDDGKLVEYLPAIKREVIYVLHGGEYGLDKDYCILGLRVYEPKN